MPDGQRSARQNVSEALAASRLELFANSKANNDSTTNQNESYFGKSADECEQLVKNALSVPFFNALVLFKISIIL